jgi:hypothetical protein
MSRHRKIILIVIGVVLLMVTIHLTINGIPALGSLNPHAR